MGFRLIINQGKIINVGTSTYMCVGLDITGTTTTGSNIDKNMNWCQRNSSSRC
ncbi:hypothetical protein HYPBUDRAFT_153330 [Hyphopichia burtonii NRRL Y-1933]|uniref:Uncharacterized protein n=1 Tax=Hyphopichia burtonii NRRL Y-1933 TaxID=984485 RepID=A0A1E4RGZ7_9ASCO|nr:hypothetical protein HYPBUDRAFT_153330 [Hyphopichia burtonii NRRL Y-1933]ODV66539.1 hypothetical protein HYPBUDRAFT_153330 [Hyphopichia burtonii NRRL Y-1933]